MKASDHKGMEELLPVVLPVLFICGSHLNGKGAKIILTILCTELIQPEVKILNHSGIKPDFSDILRHQLVRNQFREIALKFDSKWNNSITHLDIHNVMGIEHGGNQVLCFRSCINLKGSPLHLILQNISYPI